MITVDVQQYGNSALVNASGELDGHGGVALGEVLDGIALGVRDLLVDLRGVRFMDAEGLLALLEVHRRSEALGLRVLVTGWQRQPQRCLAEVAGIPGSPAAERYPAAAFRRLLEERAQTACGSADFVGSWQQRA
ncbi:STAS domain-containing protein [Streptomyces sp. NPDC051582]|uniref:STAS domain-containing protein n=1 Tax=Streptomyces sp. NPDC051582 TaxID=3155167 RepID=UPI0034481395